MPKSVMDEMAVFEKRRAEERKEIVNRITTKIHGEQAGGTLSYHVRQLGGVRIGYPDGSRADSIFIIIFRQLNYTISLFRDAAA